MQYNCIVLSLVAIGYVPIEKVATTIADQSRDASVDEYIDLVNVYFEHKHTSILTQITCFSSTENVYISAKLADKSFQLRHIEHFNQISALIDTPEHTIQGFIVDTACNNFLDIFTNDDHRVIFKNNNFWLFVDSEENNETILVMYQKQWLNTLNMLPISEAMFAKKFPNNDQSIDWILFDVYQIAPNYPLKVSTYGYIFREGASNYTDNKPDGSSQHLQTTAQFLNKSIRDDLNGLQLVCGLVIAYPERYTYLEDPKVENVDIFTKGTASVAANMRENLNMSCQIWQVDSYGWNINGTFNGVMGLFQRHEIQMLSHATIMREDRLAAVEFTAEVFVIETPIIFRQPPLSAIKNIFILPLDVAVWKCCSVIMIVVTGTMFAQFVNPILRSKMTSFDILTFVWGAVCQQGTHLIIPNTSGRYAMLTIFLATLAIFTSYSASIVAILQSPSHLIRTIDDLINSPLKMALQESGYNRYNYLMENISILNTVYEKKIKPMGDDGWIYDPFLGVEKIRTQLFAFQVEAASAYKAVAQTYTESEKCSLSELHILRLAVTTVTVERNSPYKELVKRRLRWQRENGLMDKYKRRWFPKKPDCDGGVRGFLTVGLQEVKPALILLCIANGLSLIILFMEIVLYKAKLSFERNEVLQWSNTGTNT